MKLYTHIQSIHCFVDTEMNMCFIQVMFCCLLCSLGPIISKVKIESGRIIQSWRRIQKNVYFVTLFLWSLYDCCYLITLISFNEVIYNCAYLFTCIQSIHCFVDTEINMCFIQVMFCCFLGANNF